ncbi:unknown [Firmicutes bacterium CAG:466]|nr:unknown [Firmicutes bacterium CAG:466]
MIWFNLEIRKEDATSYLSENTIWIECSLPATEFREGYIAVFYVNEDMQSIRVEYEPISEPEPSQLDIIEKEVKKKNTEIAKAAIDNYTLELVKEGVL